MTNGKEGESQTTNTEVKSNAPLLGRKRNPSLDSAILKATIEILAEVGFDAMTMDMVAGQAKVGKAALYRRWSSKTELVRDALTKMNQDRFGSEHLPDTGSLRNDLLTLVNPKSIKEGQRKLRVIAGLGSFFTQNADVCGAQNAGIFEAWFAANRKLIKRAIERGEIPSHANVELAGLVIMSVAHYRGIIEREVFDKLLLLALLDGIILPALKNPPSP